jgi:L-proline amide hydrolase
VTEGYADFRGHRTWYRVTGELTTGPTADKAPLVVVHGGPGCTHDYLDSLAELAGTGRAVVHYDQLGNGRSTHLRDRGADFWTVELFRAELANLIDHLGIAGRYHVLGQSWGGMLSAEHAVTRPTGLRSLVIADSPASMRQWLAAANALRERLPADVQAALLRHEEAGTTDSEEYAEATRVFYDRHVCRIPWPDEVARTFAAMDEDPTVYHTMNGPSEFHVVGTLKDWTIVDRLDRVAVPTFLVSGRYDEATPEVVRPYADGIADVRWQVFENSSHMPHVEEKDAFLAAVAAFLDQHD